MATIHDEKYLDYEGVEQFWDRIKRRYDNKLESVTNRDDSIKVTNKREIAVQISDEEDNMLRLMADYGKKKGLYVPPVKSMPHKLTFGAGEEFVYDGSEDITVPVYLGEINE